jgi:hypothetical protein
MQQPTGALAGAVFSLFSSAEVQVKLRGFLEEVRFYQKSWISGDRTVFDALKTCTKLKFCMLVDDSKAFHRFYCVRG